MKAIQCALVAGMIAWPPAARAGQCDRIPEECARARPNTEFSPQKRVCYEMLSACGRHQEVVDRVELEETGLAPQDTYFLGAAYFGLSGRTGAHSLRCFYSTRARDLLDGFLVKQQDLFAQQHTFGTSDDMRYVYHATRILGALGTITGCEESSHTLGSLERYGRRYTVDRIEDLFYATTPKDALQRTFDEKIESLNAAMGDFVATASRLESRFQMTSVEIEAGRQYLFKIRDRINEQFGGELVKTAVTPVGADDSFPVFTYDPGLKARILADLADRAARYRGLLAKGGEIAAIEAEILLVVDAVSMDEYARRKEETVSRLGLFAGELLVPVNFGTEMEAPERKGLKALSRALATPLEDKVLATAASVASSWSQKMRRHCTPARPAWYCRRTTP